MANIQDNGTHFTFNTHVGSIGDSFFYFNHWYGGNYVLVTLVRGQAAAQHSDWLLYLDTRGIQYEIIGTACLIDPPSVEQLFVDESTFDGLSEMYVCHRRPGSNNVPNAVYPADRYNFSEGLPDGFLDGLRALDALVYMSGGSGVNIAHKAKEEIIDYVRELSLGD